MTYVVLVGAYPLLSGLFFFDQLENGDYIIGASVLFGLAFWKQHYNNHMGLNEGIDRYHGLCTDVSWVLTDFVTKLKEEEKSKKRDLELSGNGDDSSSKKIRSQE